MTFGDRDLTGGATESKVLIGAAAAYVAAASRTDPRAALLGLPLLLWSGFGSWLTTELRVRNPALDRGASSSDQPALTTGSGVVSRGVAISPETA